GNRKIASLWHRGSFGPNIFKNEDILGSDIQIGRVNTRSQIFGILENNSSPLMLHQLRGGGRLLDDRSTWCKVAIQNCDASLRIQGRIHRLYYMLLEVCASSLQLLPQRSTRHSQRIQVQQRFELSQQCMHATSCMKVFHVVISRRLEIQQHRRIATHSIQSLQVELIAQSTCNSSQVNNGIGRAPHSQENTHRIFESCRGKDLVNRQPCSRHLHSDLTRALCNSDAVCSDCRWCCTTRNADTE